MSVSQPKRFLVIDDDQRFYNLISRYLHKKWLDATIDYLNPQEIDLEESLGQLNIYDAILIDYELGLINENGLDWIKRFKQKKDTPATIMLTGRGSELLAVRALKSGADDYLPKINITYTTLVNTVVESIRICEERSLVKQVTLGGAPARHETRRRVYKNSQENNQSSNNLDKTLVLKHTDGHSIVDKNESVPIDYSNWAQQTIDIPGYQIINKIAEGGMSSVFLTEQEDRHEEVVLKVLFLDHFLNRSALRRFMREYELISSITHPNIISIYERAFSQNFAYIAMEYLPDGDLRTKLKSGRLLPDTAIHYIKQIAMGLGEIHKHNIIHRDLKPGNILFRDDNTLAITDFGIAKSQDIDGTITHHDTVVGTPYYISPEQANEDKIDHRSDLYSLGIILFEMLTGNKPFVSKSIASLIYDHLYSPVPRLPSGFEKYQALLDGLMAKEPEERFQSADDVLAAIEWLEQRQITA